MKNLINGVLLGEAQVEVEMYAVSSSKKMCLDEDDEIISERRGILMDS